MSRNMDGSPFDRSSRCRAILEPPRWERSWGRDRLFKYITAFGFGEKNEDRFARGEPSIVHHPRYWSPVAVDTISFGQGISVTGIQLVTALSAIANGGSLMKPLIVERVTNEKGETLEISQAEMVRKVVPKESQDK